MKTKLNSLLVAGLFLAGASFPLRAQLVADGATNNISTAINLLPGDLIVGTNGGNTFLRILDTGAVTNAAGVIGFNAGSTGNQVRVNGVWRNVNALTVGRSGSDNSLIIVNAGRVESQAGSLGSQANSSNNLVSVTASGSVWTNAGNLILGSASGAVNNQLVIRNGGQVWSADGRLGFSNSGATSNTADVAGTNSLWSNSGDLYIGAASGGNLLIVSNGAVVANAAGYLGLNASSSDNTARIIGPVSLWTNSSDLYVGGGGSGNLLVVSNGASVANTLGYLGYELGSDNNSALITGSNSAWNNSSTLYVGYDGSGNQLVVGDGASVANSTGNVGYNLGSDNNSALITGSNSAWTGVSLSVGHSGSGNQLVVSNGASVANTTSVIGDNSGSDNNSALITGANSAWNNTGYLFVGYTGAGNQLVVSNGASVANDDGYIGGTSGSDNNSALITGSNSIWNNTLSFFVGYSGDGNQLTVSDGASVANAISYLGYNSDSSNNSALITGSGSAWTNSDNLLIGRSGAGNTLFITNSATVVSLDGRLGGQSGGDDNLAVVSDGGQWLANASFRVGSLGHNNELRLLVGGAATAADSAYIGSEAGSSNNLLNVAGGALTVVTNLDVRRGTLRLDSGTVTAATLLATNATEDGGGFIVFNGGTLTTTGGTVSNGLPLVVGAEASTELAVLDVQAGAGLVISGDFRLGSNAANSQLYLTNGGTLMNANARVGVAVGAGNNLAVVSGTGSLWTNSGSLYVGDQGANNQLFVTKGGNVFLTGIRIGNTAGGNQTVVTGTNSLVSSSGAVHVGYDAPGNSLMIADGASVANNNGYIGNNSASASNNWVTVTDPGSLWNLGIILFVGSSGSGNHLTVSNGASVASAGGFLGYSSSSNSALITGSNSAWNSSSSLFVGNFGNGNQLVVSNGASVANTDCFLGYNPGSDNNSALITGSNSVWNNSDILFVGYIGGGNQLTVGNGASVANTLGYLGYDAGSSNNSALITGSGSVWTNSTNLLIGRLGAGNTLFITNSATVVSLDGRLGELSGGDNNLAIVSDGGQWLANGAFRVGNKGANNELRLLTGGTATAADSAYIGSEAGSSNNLLHVDGGTLTVATNLDVRRGTLKLSSGTVTNVALLLATNATEDGGGFILFNGGTLSVSNSIVDNGAALVVGDGSSTATYQLTGNGLHTFSNGMVITNGASLKGSGTIAGLLTVAAGGAIDFSPNGIDAKELTLSNSPSLSGDLQMGIRTLPFNKRDRITVSGASLTYGGTLTVSLGAGMLANGDSFKLFDATSYAGSFSALSLPTLPGALMWTNRLSVDGSLAIVPLTSPTISSVTQSGTNLILEVTGGSPGSVYHLLTSTIVTLPLINWAVIGGGNFDWMGNVTITNGINLAEPQRYLRVRSANSTQD